MTEQLSLGKGVLVYLQDMRGAELLMIRAPLSALCSSLVAQMVKNLTAMQEIWIQSLGWEDPLEESMTTHFSILA